MVRLLICIAGVLVGCMAGFSVATAIAAHYDPRNGDLPSHLLNFLIVFLIVVIPIAGGFFADFLFNTPRKCDSVHADYDDRRPADSER